MDTQIADALRFVRQHGGAVRPAEVQEHLGASARKANEVLWTLAQRGLLARIGHGVYTADLALGRRFLLEQLERLTPA
ncbi:hypothetical protein MM1218R_03670 [Mycobacterium marinum]|nr:type IV toxin-antitoxin system AbiEi family antitoxin domain-containing protein [Mycobacterium marinum]AXN45604.1 hypothetical protein MM1218R_03670 [Mycobacterium marinum]RFZ01776.1 hypothetical protein DE4381_05223 [Mycobacterium marinum]